MTTLNPIQPHALKRKLDDGAAILVDVRESDEHAREHIIGAQLAPLSAIDLLDFDRDRGKIAVFHCRSGTRTQANAAKLIARGFREAYYLDGGIEAWKAAGLPVHSNRKAPLEIMRQVQIAAGALILVGAALGWLVNPAFLFCPPSLARGSCLRG